MAKKESGPHVKPDPTGDASSPSPDENVVEEIGEKAGVTYEENEPLRTTEKVGERDRKRWELDPVSSEDYEERAAPDANSD
jgi:hypothetical protein